MDCYKGFAWHYALLWGTTRMRLRGKYTIKTIKMQASDNIFRFIFSHTCIKMILPCAIKQRIRKGELQNYKTLSIASKKHY